MTRLLLVARDRNLNLTEFLSHNLTQFPSSLCGSHGTMQWTTKASLLHYFECRHPESRVEHPPPGRDLIINGMALIQEVADRIPATFGELSTFILSHIMTLGAFYSASHIDFVCDRCFGTSVKNAERSRRAGGANQSTQRAFSVCQKAPQQFRKFLMSKKNKESLCQFIVIHWRTVSGTELFGKTLYFTIAGNCFAMQPTLLQEAY